MASRGLTVRARLAPPNLDLKRPWGCSSAGERSLRMGEVRGSNPLSSTTALSHASVMAPPSKRFAHNWMMQVRILSGAPYRFFI
jgi:hypothetical protein